MKVAFIHSEKKLATGAHHINNLMSIKLKENGVIVEHYYPKTPLLDASPRFKGIQNILFFHSLLEKKEKILRCNLIQGTTYTPIAYLAFPIPIVSHFGSTTRGFLNAVPRTFTLDKALKSIFHSWKSANVINELNIKTRQPLRDIADMESYVAKRVDGVIATSNIVRDNLINEGVEERNIYVVHNAIEDFWFENGEPRQLAKPKLVYIGRIGGDVFTLKLKGVDRLISLYGKFSSMDKLTIVMTPSKKISHWIRGNILNSETYTNLLQSEITNKLKNEYGSFLFIPSRYEGLCLSLVEGMSQGLIPITFPVGVAPEIIQNGQNGFIVNSVGEAEKIIKKYKGNDEARKCLARGAYDTAQQFRADVMARQLTRIYENIIINYSKVRKRKTPNINT